MLQGASRIYAAYLTNMELTDRTNRFALMRQAIESAFLMAEMADEMMISDLERR